MAEKSLILTMSPDTLNRESFGSLFFYESGGARHERRQDPGKQGADHQNAAYIKKMPAQGKEVTMSYISRYYFKGNVSVRIASRQKMRIMKAMARAARRDAGLPVKAVSFFIPVNNREWQKIATL